MAVSVDEAKSAVQTCYPSLLQLLPISKLVDHFYSRKLLPFDRKKTIDSITSLEEKTKHFLDAVLIPGLNIGYTGHFEEMMIMMKESDDVLVKCLVEKLEASLAPAQQIEKSKETLPTNTATAASVQPTYQTLLPYFERVDNWKLFGSYLLPEEQASHVINAIEMTYKGSVDECRLALLNRYLQMGEVSWNKVIDSLEKSHFTNISKKIKKDIFNS